MSDTPIFGRNTDSLLGSDIKPRKPDARAAKVAKVHREIVGKVRDGSIYRDSKKRR